MFGILVSALNVILGFVLRSAVLKVGVMFAVSFLAVELVSEVVHYVPALTSLSGIMSSWPSGLWYFIDLMRLDVGLPLVLSALATRFLIRRIPGIG